MKAKTLTGIAIATLLVSCGGGNKASYENTQKTDKDHTNQSKNSLNLKNTTQISQRNIRLNGVDYSINAKAIEKLGIDINNKVDYVFSINLKSFSLQIPKAYQNEDITIEMISLKTNHIINAQGTKNIIIPKQNDYAIPFQNNSGDDTPQTPVF